MTTGTISNVKKGDYFLAYIDICGFKNMMKDKKDTMKALKTLDRLYQKGYDLLERQTCKPKVTGWFFSDSGLLVALSDINGRRGINRELAENNRKKEFTNLLSIVGLLNEKLFEDRILLTTTIAFGEFQYIERTEGQVTGKMMVYGSGFVNAYSDQDNFPKLLPGQCRIIKKNLPAYITSDINPKKMINVGKTYFYYYWMNRKLENSSSVYRRYGFVEDEIRTKLINRMFGKYKILVKSALESNNEEEFNTVESILKKN